MYASSTQYRMRQCSKCTSTTEYFCESCTFNLCNQCNWNHAPYPKVLDHDVGIYRDKFNHIPKQETCVQHPDRVYIKYCELCELPVCYHCRKHRNHKQLDVIQKYQTMQRQHNRTIKVIRTEALLYLPILLEEVRANVKDCQSEFSLYYSNMLNKVKILRKRIDKLMQRFNLKHNCLKSKRKMNSYISSIQKFEHSYEHASIMPIQFIKQKSYEVETHKGSHLTHHTKRFFVNESLNKNDVIKFLTDIKLREKGKRRVLRLMSAPESHSVSLEDLYIGSCCHISRVSSDRVWVSDSNNNLILANRTGDLLYHLEIPCFDFSTNGLHTVNNDGELIYIDEDFNINKLSKDFKTTTPIIEKKDASWRPMCLFFSLNTGDLLVGMYNTDTCKANVTRCNQNGQITQTIQYGNTGMHLYRYPINITENNNGDVVVSDHETAIVVTERGGKHRFSYKGHPLGSGLSPCGICTDALSHILVCDELTDSVQMLDKDGRFLSHLLTRPSGIFYPVSLSYDVKTHHLWIGSWNHTNICVLKYISREHALTNEVRIPASNSCCIYKRLNHAPAADVDCYPAIVDVIDSPNNIQITEEEIEEKGNKNTLHLMSTPEFQKSLSVAGVKRCYHINRVIYDRVWVSDKEVNLILANSSGDTLHHLKVFPYMSYNGLHTVSENSELFYIDTNFNINKLSIDLKTTATFIESKNVDLYPRCLYVAPFTGDLLVGMTDDDISLVARYNETGKLTQRIKRNNAGFDIYRNPIYITENKNGDIVVSDYDKCFNSGAVVVTNSRGMHRFSYKGHPLGSRLVPNGICTDALSNILVCDDHTKTVQMLNKNGQFLSHLLIRPSGIFSPTSLSYDVKTHCLWVGSGINNKICAYRYISGQETSRATSDVIEDTEIIRITTTENMQEENSSLRKLMLPPKLHKCFKVPGEYDCFHISLVTADMFWFTNNAHIGLVNTNNASSNGDDGILLCECIKVLNKYILRYICHDYLNGQHAVNNEHDLIYIDGKCDIMKWSIDMEIPTILITRTENNWESRCVYWSPFTNDLLVGLCNKESLIGKIARYDQTGQLTQTIQNDNTGLEMFHEPNYITDNRNGDVVVSDSIEAVIVTEREGKYRFSYTGHPPGSGLRPYGICTDVLSNILVCDGKASAIHILNKNGQFLSHFRTESQNMTSPLSLRYDFNTNYVWIGSSENKVYVYSYITRQDSLTDNS